MYYIMPHCPGESPKEWRMMLYSDLARGVNIVNLFDFWTTIGTTENNVVPGHGMYEAVLQGLWEVGSFEDILIVSQKPNASKHCLSLPLNPTAAVLPPGCWRRGGDPARPAEGGQGRVVHVERGGHLEGQ
jgi:hypothetical protein